MIEIFLGYLNVGLGAVIFAQGLAILLKYS